MALAGLRGLHGLSSLGGPQNGAVERAPRGRLRVSFEAAASVTATPVVHHVRSASFEAAAALTAERASDGIDADAQAVIDAMSPTPDAARQGVIDDLVTDLKGFGLWSKIDVLALLACHAAGNEVINWVSPGTNDLDPINSPAFTVDGGVVGGGNGHYNSIREDEAFPGPAGAMAIWSFTQGAETHGGACGGNSTLIAPRRQQSGNAFVHRVIANPTINAGVQSDGRGLWMSSHTSSGVCQGYRNGVAQGASSTTYVAGSTFRLAVGARRINETIYPAETQLGLFMVSSDGFTAQEAADFYTAVNTYMTAIGAV